MTPEAVIRLARANPGTPVRLKVRTWHGLGEVCLKWEEGRVRFWIPRLRSWGFPEPEHDALSIMEVWRILEARLEKKRERRRRHSDDLPRLIPAIPVGKLYPLAGETEEEFLERASRVYAYQFVGLPEEGEDG